MEGSKLESEVRVVEDIDLKHVRIPIYRSRARRLNLLPRVKPKKNSSTSTTKKDQRLVIATLFPSHEVFMFLNQQFLGVLQVEYQNKTKSPFETHPIHMWTFLTSICFYSVVLAFKLHPKARTGHFAIILENVLILSGLLSSASLLSILQPRHHFWFLYAIGLYIPLMLAHHYFLKSQVLNVVTRIMTSAFLLRDNLNLFCGRIRQ